MTVADDGAGAAGTTAPDARGTGLRHLRERLGVLFGSQASLTVETTPGAGFTARLSLPVGDAR